MRLPSITIAICTHARPQFLREALRSAEAQRVSSGVEWKVLVVDNNSMDATAPVVAEFRERGKLELHFAHEPRTGLSHARRRAIQESESDLIAFIDDDCVLEPGWIDEVAVFFQEHPGAGAIGGKVELVWQAIPDALIQQYARAYASQDHGPVPVQAPAGAIAFLVGAGLVVSRRAVTESAWANTFRLSDRRGGHLASGGDSELVLRIRAAGYEVWYNPGMRLRHVIAPERITHDYLCRLARGLGESEPALWVTAHPSLLARVVGPPLLLSRAVTRLLIGACRYGISPPRDEAAGRVRVQLQWSRGHVIGSLRLLRSRSD